MASKYHVAVRVLFVSSRFGTPRHRCQYPREGLAHLGVDADVALAEEGDLLARAAGFTHVVLNRVPFDGPAAPSRRSTPLPAT